MESNPSIKKELLGDAAHWMRVVFSMLLFSLLALNFVALNATVRHGSMERALSDGDRIIAFRLAYVVRPPGRHDVVVFRRGATGRDLYVKRVIGLPGDEVMVSGGEVFVNGAAERGFAAGATPGELGPVLVPDGHVFVLGDNRGGSQDSRHWPEIFVPVESVLGRAVLRYYPVFGLVGGA